MSKPRLKMDLFEPMWATFALVRQTLEDATAATLQMAPKRGQPFPDQVAVMRYCMDWTVARANALVRKRCGEEDLARARTADPFSFGQYRLQLQALRLKAAEEAFQAARRVVGSIQVSCAISQYKLLSLTQLLRPGGLPVTRRRRRRILHSWLFHL